MRPHNDFGKCNRQLQKPVAGTQLDNIYIEIYIDTVGVFGTFRSPGSVYKISVAVAGGGSCRMRGGHPA